ncbi:MAG TPA: hypothetical protein VH436_22040 [Vicinamibacterales bacterium]|jgi:hypothetical protein
MKYCGVFLLFVLAVIVVAAQQPETVMWRNGEWFDGRQFRHVDVYSIGDRLTLKHPSKVDRTVDLTGRFLTGAFGEAHNHNIPSDDTERTIRTYLGRGIFYVMIQTNVPQAPATLKGLINRPDSVDVLFSNGSFTAPGGHPSALVRRNIANGGMTTEDLDGGFIHTVRSREDIDRVWSTRIKTQKPDFIKLTLVYSEDRVAGLPRPDSDRHGLDPSLTSYLVGKAHGDRLRVSAHVESAYDFDVAVAAGVDLIAHMPGFCCFPGFDPNRVKAKGTGIYRISDDAARRAAHQGTVVITTVASEGLQKATPETRAQVLDVLRWNFEILKRHGVKIAIGSDQFRSSSVPEALMIAQAGLMTRAEVLQSLSVTTPAAIFPQRAPFGLAEGAPASFIAFDRNPLDDLESITRISLRVKEGRELNFAR